MTPFRTQAPHLALAFSAALLAAAPLAAAPPAAEQLSLEWIMADPLTWLGRPPVDFYFSDDGKSVYFTQDRVGRDGRDLSRIELKSGATTLVEDAQRGQADGERGAYSLDRRFKTWSADGDIFWKDLQTGEKRQLTRTAAAETAPLFLLDGRVAFQRGDAIFVRDLKTGLEEQAADLQLAKDPQDKPDPEDYIGKNQARLFDVVRERQERKKEAELRRRARQASDPTQPPLAFFLGDGQKIAAQFLSPTGRAMLVVLEPKEVNEGRAEKMANFVSNDGYIEILEVRTKVGTGKPVSPTFALLDLEKHERYDFDPKILSKLDDDPLADLRQAAEERKEAAKKAAEAKKAGGGESIQKESTVEDAKTEAENLEGGVKETSSENALAQQAENEKKEAALAAAKAEPDCPPAALAADAKKATRTFEFGDARFSPDGRRVVIAIRSSDNKDRWLVSGALDEPRFKELHQLRRRGWINWDFNEFGFLPGPAGPAGPSLYFMSEESGYSQLYLHDFAKGENRRLTSGDFTVGDPTPSPDGKWIYVAANPEHPGIFGVYRAATGAPPAGARSWEAVTSLGGLSEFRLSHDGQSLLLFHSSKLAPPELYLQEAKPGAKARQITRTTLEKFAAHSWVEPEVVAIPSRHGGPPIYSRYYAPRATAAKRGQDGKVPAVMFIHGAGYLQNAHHGWSTYFREFFFHTWLAEHGYAVLDMDYRGSAGYGADFREAIYRHMGGPEVEDLEDGLAWLAENHGVDPQRVGLYGGSYGGFLTMMGLFTRPEVFACGAALRPVTDWAHYNHGYTSNILNTPDLDPEAYARSSPIEFAAGLTKPLLICSPMQDDNVFFQDSVLLVQKLIELEKNDWEIALYPVEPHGFRRPSSWLDEYKRIFKLFESCLDVP
jgi:dipeptidyl aminopeptidase/acylaminoacyl peptidase